jgi:hypothetical protein
MEEQARSPVLTGQVVVLRAEQGESQTRSEARSSTAGREAAAEAQPPSTEAAPLEAAPMEAARTVAGEVAGTPAGRTSEEGSGPAASGSAGWRAAGWRAAAGWADPKEHAAGRPQAANRAARIRFGSLDPAADRPVPRAGAWAQQDRAARADDTVSP